MLAVSDFADAICLVYTYAAGVLMSPTLGVVFTDINGDSFCLTVRHTFDGRDGFEVWTGWREDTLPATPKTWAPVCIHGKCDHLTSVRAHPDLDLAAIPLPSWRGPAFGAQDLVRGAGLLSPLLVALPELEIDCAAGAMVKRLSGVAGLVSRETPTHIVLAAYGAEGMSGAPVVKIGGQGECLLVGLYVGTPGKTPVSNPAMSSLASIVKTERWCSAGFAGPN